MATAATTNALSQGVAKVSRTRLEEPLLEADELAAVKAELEQVRAQLYGVLEGARTAFSAADGIVRALAGAEQIDEVADSVLDVLCEAFEFDAATFWLLDPENGKLFAIAHRQAPTRRGRFIESEIRSLQMSLNEGVAGRVFMERKEFLSDDALSIAHPALASLLEADGLRGVCAFTVDGHDGSPLGVIEMERREPLAPDHAIDSAVRLIGERIGAFIEFSQLHWRYFSLVADLKRGPGASPRQSADAIPLELAD
jgi:hypothetical protein